MSTQVTVHREQRFTNCFNVHDAGNEMGLLIKNIESVYGQQISLDEQVSSPASPRHTPRRGLLAIFLSPARCTRSRRNQIARRPLWRTSSGVQLRSCSSYASIRWRKSLMTRARSFKSSGTTRH